MDVMKNRSPWTIAPLFVVEDVVASANFYRDTLGFSYDQFFGDPPAFCMVKRGGIIIMLSQLPGKSVARPNRLDDRGGEAWDAYVWVDDADALHQEFKQKGAKIAGGLCDKPYLMREFDVKDLSGYRICFGHDISE